MKGRHGRQMGGLLPFFSEGRGADQGPTLWTVDVTGYNERPIDTRLGI